MQVLEAVEKTGNMIFGSGLQNVNITGSLEAGGDILAVLMGVIAALMIFAGLKCRYVLYGIQGFVVGLLGGFTAGWFAGINTWVIVIIALASGILLCIGEVALKKFGTFLFTCCVMFLSVFALIQTRSYVIWLIIAAASIVVAVLTVVFMDPLIIPVMALGGGVLGGAVLMRYVPLDQNLVFYMSVLILTIIGISVQYGLQARKIIKNEQEKVKQIRQKKSVESEIEMARNILDPEEKKEIQETDKTNEQKSESTNLN